MFEYVIKIFHYVLWPPRFTISIIKYISFLRQNKIELQPRVLRLSCCRIGELFVIMSVLIIGMVDQGVHETFSTMDKTEELKKAAAEAAIDFIRAGMLVGLGTGSTAEYAIEELSRRVRDGRLSDISCVPSSRRTRDFAEALGLHLIDLGSVRMVDVTVDGADEIDTAFNLIKGGGGALLWEKVLAQNSRRNIVVVDESKLSRRLGEHFPVPVEVLGVALEAERGYLERLGGNTRLRLSGDGSPFITDQGNYIVDWVFGEIDDPSFFAERLSARAGIAEHGLFIGTATDVIVAFPDEVKHFVIREEI